MATVETQILDDIIVASRRKMLSLGTAALAGLAFTGTRTAHAQAPAYADSDILNFALNLEYLEANFYYLAAFGTTIDVANAASTAAGAVRITLNSPVGTPGTVTVKTNAQVPFQTTTVGSYAVETAVEEGKHVAFLQGALGTAAVAQPAIDLQTSFNTLASAATNGGTTTFDPFASDNNFLVGAYIFEDVGVTAYHGAAPLLTTTAQGKTYLAAAAGILAVEAYHAGLVRTTINAIDSTGTLGLVALTNAISALRATLSLAALAAAPNPDDYGLAGQTVTVGASTGLPASRIVDSTPDSVLAFSRNTTQVLNIVTGGGAINGTATVSPARGVFYPAGLNGLFK